MFPISATCKTVVNVPSTLLEDASFSSISSGSFVVRGGDGACAVIGKGALICALLGSRFSVHDTDREGHVKTALSNGGFLVTVGSKSMVFKLDKYEISAREALILVTKNENDWVVKAESFFLDGTVEISVLEAPPSKPKSIPEKSEHKSEPTEMITESPLMPDVEKHSLKKGQAVHMGKNRKWEPALQGHQTALKDLASRLNEPGLTGSLLSPQDVEDSTDFVSQKVDKDMAFEDIEIEEIEVEAGCVEICID
ncbi:MAG: hypothetical protein GY847_36850 [Proteobacteria bacterium]|nr:hypothetical protein [Pseudomonadota bacterium]